MKIGTIITEEVVTAFAPDGNWQPMITGEDLSQIVGFTEMLKLRGISMSFNEMLNKGFTVVKAKITIEVTGNIDDSFRELQDTLANPK